MSIAAQFDLEIDQMDAVTAFLQGDLTEDIYMLQPQCFSDGTAKVCHLKKSLYGLKQASRVWNAKLNAALIQFGMVRSKADPCIYYKRTHEKIIIVAVYVDDILLLPNDEKLKFEIKAKLSSSFQMKDLGRCTSILGMNITRNRNEGTIAIDQANYIAEALERFGMQDCHAVSSPMDANVELSKEMSPSTEAAQEAMKSIPYQEAVGSLMYAAQVSRPDICFALSVISRFNHNPGSAHWQTVKRILRYLKGTIDSKLVFSRNNDTNLIGYCDADFASDIDDRKSTTGYVFVLNGGAISWNSRKQPTVALSTAEAEYMSLTAAAREAIWLRQLNNELIDTESIPVQIYCDSKSALCLASNDMYHPKTKHIDVKFHFIREKINLDLIHVNFVGTDEQIADVLTKALVPFKHKNFISKFGIFFA